MTGIVYSDMSLNILSYDADGLRRVKEDSSGTAKFIWDEQNVFLETNGADVTQVIYSLEPMMYGNLLSQRRGAVSSFYHFDALGSTDRLTNSAETVTDSYIYEAFGTVKASSGTTTNPFRYVGKLGYHWDPDPALHYLRARYYSSAPGRFLSVDPLIFRLLSTGAAEYLYTRNRVTSMVDTSAWLAEDRGTWSLLLSNLEEADSKRKGPV